MAYNKYGRYCVPLSSSHRPAAQSVLSGAVYEPETIQYILNNCKNGDIIHAGTFFGDFLPALSKGIDKDSRIWAFEPNSENHLCARITMNLNLIRNVSLFNAGLGSKQDTSLVEITDFDGRALGGGSRIVSKSRTGEQITETVVILPLDGVLDPSRPVSIIQLDVEGYEQEALAGAMQTIQRWLPDLIIEDLPGSTIINSKWFEKNIKSLGYSLIKRIHGNVVFSVFHISEQRKNDFA